MAVFRILSLDGGGIRGIATTAFLAAVERNLDRPIVHYFDLIVGTSTAGIIALGLAAGKSAKEVEKFYAGWGVFTRNKNAKPGILLRLGVRAVRRLIPEGSTAPIDPPWIAAPKYDAAILSRALHELFRDRLLGDLEHRVIIPSLDLIKGQTVVFRTPHLPGMVRDLKLPVESVALAGASLPTYFAPATITKGSLYADCGRWANNPTLVGFIEMGCGFPASAFAMPIQNSPGRTSTFSPWEPGPCHTT